MNGTQNIKRMQWFFPTLTGSPYFCFPESAGCYLSASDHNVKRSATEREDFSIHVITKGKGYLEFEGKTYMLQEGDGFLYFPNQVQRYYSSEDDPWDVRWVHFYGNKLKEFLTEQGFHRTPLWTLKQLSQLEEVHQELMEEANAYRWLRPAKLSAHTYEVLAVFVSQAIPLTPNLGTEPMERIYALLPDLQTEAVHPFILEDWTQRAGVSSYYFCRLFKKAMSMTPSNYITLCRIQLAKQWLLEKPDWPIKRVSMECGYSNISYFNKRFLEHEGLTPGEYRRLHLSLR